MFLVAECTRWGQLILVQVHRLCFVDRFGRWNLLSLRNAVLGKVTFCVISSESIA